MSTDPTAGWLAGEPGEDVLEPFLREGCEVVRELAVAVEGLGGAGSAQALESLAVLTHRLSGSASLYGLSDIASLAGAMERAVAGVAGGGEERRQRGRE
jgi:hypothetical protein